MCWLTLDEVSIRSKQTRYNQALYPRSQIIDERICEAVRNIALKASDFLHSYASGGIKVLGEIQYEVFNQHDGRSFVRHSADGF